MTKWIILLLIVNFDHSSGRDSFVEWTNEKQTCKIDRNGVLTTFAGEKVTVTSPCKFFFAQFSCGGYKVKVAAGNSMATSEDSVTFTPSVVSLSVQSVNGNKAAWKVLRKKLSAGWNKDRKSEPVGVDFEAYDQILGVAAVRKDGVFDVEFDSDGQLITRCYLPKQFSAKPLPENLCGDGSHDKVTENAAREMHVSMRKENYVNLAILTSDVTQSKNCKPFVGTLKNCGGSRGDAFSKCDVIMTDARLVQCLTSSSTSLEKHYSGCLKAVCLGYTSELDATNSHIASSCEGVTQIEI